MLDIEAPCTDRIDAGAPAEKIEVTPAMIEAGLRVFGCSVPDYGGWCADTAAEIVEKIIGSALTVYADKTAPTD
jgi:hypothetical protein